MDLAFRNNQNFVFQRSLAPWSVLYDLGTGVLRCQMRPRPESPVLVYEWTTANDLRGTGKGLIEVLSVKALGTFAFSDNPVAGDVLTFGSAVVTFVADNPSNMQVQIRPTLEGTLSALADRLQASTDPDVVQCTYALAANVLLVEFKVPGEIGNAYEIGAASEAVTASGPTLTEGGEALLMTAPIGDMQAFTGSFVYDVRFERAPDLAVLFGGTISFTQGVTR